ncbi:hypothetical protein HNP73_004072 [Amaricoccus macauensis]|uniref:Uncharacterized protein n=1 Tax=Amaricoccus macauensis TaxID=57001 RepID=A0A840SYC4_9RHOB|nr:hypothetical protein [Amaricoccus macauensis]
MTGTDSMAGSTGRDMTGSAITSRNRRREKALLWPRVP